MPGRHRKKTDPDADARLTPKELRKKLRITREEPQEDPEDSKDFPAVHGTLDIDDND